MKSTVTLQVIYQIDDEADLSKEDIQKIKNGSSPIVDDMMDEIWDAIDNGLFFSVKVNVKNSEMDVTFTEDH